MPKPIVWGHTSLMLTHECFAHGYHKGRQFYFEDWPPECSLAQEPLTAHDLLQLIAVPDQAGYYQLERDRELTTLRNGVEELFGVLVGYLSGPLHPEQAKDQEQRLGTHVMLDEGAAPSLS